MHQLTIGIVGAGGTGSAVAEQLIRLGVGRIITADGESLEDSMSRASTVPVRMMPGKGRSRFSKRHADEIGLGTVVEILPGNITKRSVIERFRSCDLIFGCTDREAGRSILTVFALDYLIPSSISG